MAWSPTMALAASRIGKMHAENGAFEAGIGAQSPRRMAGEREALGEGGFQAAHGEVVDRLRISREEDRTQEGKRAGQWGGTAERLFLFRLIFL